MTKAELLAAAEALEQMAEECLTSTVLPQSIPTRLFDRAESFRAQAAAAGASMTEPIATPSSRWHENGQPDPHGNRYDCERAELCMGHLTDDELANAVFLHGDTQPSFADIASGKAVMPIAYLTAAKDRIRWLSRKLEEARPAPALSEPVALPIDGDKAWRVSSTGYSIKQGWGSDKRIVCIPPGGLQCNSKTFEQWLKDADEICKLHNQTPAPAPTEHTAADAPNREAGSKDDMHRGVALSAATSAAGVPDVDGLVKKLSDWYEARYPLDVFLGEPAHPNTVLLKEAAQALAALQSQLAAEKDEVELKQACIAGMRKVEEQQAERIKELKADLNSEGTRSVELLRRSRKAEAKLAEAVEVFRWLNVRGGLGLDVHERISVAIQKAREVMG